MEHSYLKGETEDVVMTDGKIINMVCKVKSYSYLCVFFYFAILKGIRC